jgi:enamine deaminase RidA (YjgF/YER057c/UK114 family)
MHHPTAYSHAVRKRGTPLYIAGQVALDASGAIVGEGDIEAQVEQVYRNIRGVVEAAGGSMADIVKITIYTTDLAYRTAIGAARERHLAEPKPASTFLVISSLAQPGFLVEIEAVAIIEQA